jgi:hypothetical protein
MHVMTPEFNLWENLFVFWVWHFFLSLLLGHSISFWSDRPVVMLSGFRLLILQAKFVSNVILDVPVTDVLILWNICVTNGYGYFLRSNHNLVLSLFMTYHGACTTINTTSSPPVFSGICVAQYLLFCVVFCRSLFVLLSFFLLARGVFAVMSVIGLRIYLSGWQEMENFHCLSLKTQL